MWVDYRWLSRRPYPISEGHIMTTGKNTSSSSLMTSCLSSLTSLCHHAIMHRGMTIPHSGLISSKIPILRYHPWWLCKFQNTASVELSSFWWLLCLASLVCVHRFSAAAWFPNLSWSVPTILITFFFEMYDKVTESQARNNLVRSWHYDQTV